MEITKEALEIRLQKLLQEREMLQNELIQKQANLHAYDGAIEDCQYWLAQLTKEDLAGG